MLAFSVFLIVIFSLAFIALMWALIRVRANHRRELSMVFLKILIPKKESKEDREKEGSTYASEQNLKEYIGVMSHFFEAIHSIHEEDYKYHIIGQDFFSLEYAVFDNLIYLYMVAPREIVPLIEKQVTGFYSDAYIEEVEDYNIFKPN